MSGIVNTALIASGTGSDAESIIKAYINGFIPEIDLKYLISTKKDAGCIKMAEDNHITTTVIDCPNTTDGNFSFNNILSDTLSSSRVQLVFLVGCIKQVALIRGIDFYNIHPADPIAHGGKGMYGLDVHEHVLASIKDRLTRKMALPESSFYTYPTVHRVDADLDTGPMLLRAKVQIPGEIISKLNEDEDISQLDSELQQHVLPYEWIMLPSAVRMAAHNVLY